MLRLSPIIYLLCKATLYVRFYRKITLYNINYIHSNIQLTAQMHQSEVRTIQYNALNEVRTIQCT